MTIGLDVQTSGRADDWGDVRAIPGNGYIEPEVTWPGRGNALTALPRSSASWQAMCHWEAYRSCGMGGRRGGLYMLVEEVTHG